MYVQGNEYVIRKDSHTYVPYIFDTDLYTYAHTSIPNIMICMYVCIRILSTVRNQKHLCHEVNVSVSVTRAIRYVAAGFLRKTRHVPMPFH